MQRPWFLDVMVSKRRSKAKTVSCVSWNVRGLPQPTLTFGVRKCGPRFVITRQPRIPCFHAILKGPTLILAGRTKAQTDETIMAAVDKKELPAMEAGAMCYMMSKQGYGGDSVKHWPPHVMFYYSQTDPATWGANLPGSPIMAVSDEHEHLTEHLTMFSIGVQRWSDETEGR